MSDYELQPPPRPKKKGPSLGPVILALILLVAAAGAGVYLVLRPEGAPWDTARQKEAKPATTQSGPAQPAVEQKTAAEKPQEPEMKEVVLPATGNQPEAKSQTQQCANLAKKLHDFCQHVDQQDYLPRFSLNEPAQARFIALADKLLANPPVVARETDDLYTILRNSAHIFRVIGKDNTLLLKTVLDRERDQTEEVASDLYLWLSAEGCQEALLPFSPPLAKVYEYAGFLLNTLGGRSYLFRRDARTRLLITYYAVLIIDRANAQGLNRYGIDINQPVTQLISEIEASTQLAHKETYLERLYKIQETLPQQNDAAK